MKNFCPILHLMAVVVEVHNVLTEGGNMADLSKILTRTGILTSLLKHLDVAMILLKLS